MATRTYNEIRRQFPVTGLVDYAINGVPTSDSLRAIHLTLEGLGAAGQTAATLVASIANIEVRSGSVLVANMSGAEARRVYMAATGVQPGIYTNAGVAVQTFCAFPVMFNSPANPDGAIPAGVPSLSIRLTLNAAALANFTGGSFISVIGEYVDYVPAACTRHVAGVDYLAAAGDAIEVLGDVGSNDLLEAIIANSTVIAANFYNQITLKRGSSPYVNYTWMETMSMMASRLDAPALAECIAAGFATVATFYIPGGMAKGDGQISLSTNRAAAATWDYVQQIVTPASVLLGATGVTATPVAGDVPTGSAQTVTPLSAPLRYSGKMAGGMF